jgi:hypothetical protein
METGASLAGSRGMAKEHDIDDRNLGGPDQPHANPVVEPGVCPECRGAGTTLTGDVCPMCEGTGRANARVGGG